MRVTAIRMLMAHNGHAQPVRLMKFLNMIFSIIAERESRTQAAYVL